MELFLCVVTDIIHFIAILFSCNLFFSLEWRKDRYNRLKLVGVLFCVSIISIFIFYIDNTSADACVYVLSMILFGCLLYKEKKCNIAIVILWTIFVLSVVDVMASVLFRIIFLLLNVEEGLISNLLVAIVSLMLVYSVGISFKKRISTTLQTIGMANLVGFTILLMIDFFVVTAIVVGADMYEADIRNVYLIAVVFVIIGVFIQLAAVIILFAQRNVYKEKKQLSDAYLAVQKNHYEYLENRERETKKFRHDLRNHMELISNLAQNQEYGKINEYLEQINMRIDTFGNIVTVHNGMVDAIINQYYMRAEQGGVKMKVEGKFPVDCEIETYDLCTIFSNVLSNAYEAAVETEDKFVTLVCGYTERTIIIDVKNSCRNEVSAGGMFWKTKKNNADYHGYGLENIKDSVKKYDGIFDIEVKDNVCMLKISFNRKTELKVEEQEKL